MVTGSQENISKANIDLDLLQKRLKIQIKKIQITDPKLIQAIKMKGYKNCEIEFKVKIFTLTKEEAKR